MSRWSNPAKEARRMRRIMARPLNDLGEARVARGVERRDMAEALGVVVACVAQLERRSGTSPKRRAEYLSALASLPR